MRLLVAADALELEPLRALCEAKLAQAVDADQVLEVLLLAEELHCCQLREFCLHYLQQHLGPLRRLAVSLPPPPPLEGMSGFERLTGHLLEEVQWVVNGHAQDDAAGE